MICRPTQSAVELNQLKLQIWDLGGEATVRSLWRDHCIYADGILFLVDAKDALRVPEAAAEVRENNVAKQCGALFFWELRNVQRISIVFAENEESFHTSFNFYLK